MGVANLSGLEDYLFAVLGVDERGNLPCTLADGIFGESAVVMTPKVRVCADTDERRLYRRMASIQQPIELQYGNFFHKFRLLRDIDAFRLLAQEHYYSLLLVYQAASICSPHKEYHY